MLSHLRFHRRAPSNPTSPLPDQLSSWEATAVHEHPQTTQDVSPLPDIRPRSSNSAHMPPVLPPITRVTSAGFTIPSSGQDARPSSQDSRVPSSSRTGHDTGNTGFLGGATLQNHRASGQSQGMPSRSDSAGPPGQQVHETLLSRSKPPPPPINTGFASRFAPTSSKPQSSFVTPTDLAQNSTGFTGKRPAGTRVASEPPNPTAGPETHKGKRSLPFLKNPMSTLLMRRKTAQPAPEIQPMPPPTEPTYDPRIRGTRVHDFSAPRPKRTTPNTDANITSPPVLPPSSDPTKPHYVGEQTRVLSAGTQQSTPSGPNNTVNLENQGAHMTNNQESVPSEAELFSVRRPQEQLVPSVPENDYLVGSVHTSSSTTSRAISVETAVLGHTTSSTRKAKASNPSLSRASTRASVMSSIPKHMKSTSSRFSFDMIGSAGQEKELEERHRQREQEKKINDDAMGPRDSRFDDFDDDFDYDAMMDDDGLEERIPGVNADLEDDYGLEDTEDPDNDQENFSGFVFQRSNPASSLASPNTPAMLVTPRDANGKVIGFAMTKDTTPELLPTALPLYPQDMSGPPKQDDPSGLGIEELKIKHYQNGPDSQLHLQSSYEQLVVGSAPKPGTTHGDELYFDDGLADELDFEHDGTVFDESIFDNLDTDQYGRPIPGAFARAHEAMRTAQKQQGSKRDSDEVTVSQFEGQTGPCQSTAHTSLSVGLQPAPPPPVNDMDVEKQPPVEQPLDQMAENAPVPGQDLLYQAALAAAAQQAAASGKFRRSSSPLLPAELTITSPTDSSDSFQPNNLDEALDDDDDDDDGDLDNGYNPDDYEADEPYSTYIDDDVIAEANASALANDSDGFYGQEFGFYSAPVTQPHHNPHSHYYQGQGHGHQNSTSSTASTSPSPSANVPLSAENLFQYANGGYFGPAGGNGIYRSQSGRIVSREPNLTPITERSEYSNRNSVMSLALPPAIGTESGRNSAAGGMMPSSPGLAQLALLSEEELDGGDFSMSMMALMKLRSKAWGGGAGGGSGGGGSQSSREGSPRSERAVPPLDGANSPFGGGMFGAGLQQYQYQQHARKGSSFSAWSGNSDPGIAIGEMPWSGSSPASPNPIMPTMMMLQPQAGHTQEQYGVGMNAYGPPLASSPLPPPLSDQQQQQHLLISSHHSGSSLSPISIPSLAHNIGGASSNNACSPVLESEETENGFGNDRDDAEGEKTITVGGFSGIDGNNMSSVPAPLPTLQTGVVGSGGSKPGSRPISPTLTRRPASASGSGSGGGSASASSGHIAHGYGHRHKGSADSISYVPVSEDDMAGLSGLGQDGTVYGAEDGSPNLSKRGSGGTRWVMERRRTDESTGEVEILEREVVEGGRI